MLFSMFVWVANAQVDISDLFYENSPLVENAYMKILNEYDNAWWYSSSSLVECESNGGISVRIPAIEDWYLDKVTKYRFFFSPYRLNQLKRWDSSVDISKIISKEIIIDNNASEVRFNVSNNDIDSETAYYGFIVPIDTYDWVWVPSAEICFQLDNNICLQDSACDTLDLVIHPIIEPVIDPTPVETTEITEQWLSHGAASCVGMDMANVTHTIKWDTLTLRWTAVAGDKVEVAIYDPDREIYKSLWFVNMNREKFDYKIERDGEQNFMLTNGCKELYYKADAELKKTPTVEPKEDITTIPETGPAENILFIAIAAIVIYVAYALFFRRSED